MIHTDGTPTYAHREPPMADVSHILAQLSEVEEANFHRRQVGRGPVVQKVDATELLKRDLREAHLRDALEGICDVVDAARSSDKSNRFLTACQTAARAALLEYDAKAAS